MFPMPLPQPQKDSRIRIQMMEQQLPPPSQLLFPMPLPLPKPPQNKSRSRIRQQLSPPKNPLPQLLLFVLHPQFVADKSLIFKSSKRIVMLYDMWGRLSLFPDNKRKIKKYDRVCFIFRSYLKSLSLSVIFDPFYKFCVLSGNAAIVSCNFSTVLNLL